MASFSRKAIKAMGIDEEKIDLIIDLHTEVVDGLKEELKTAKESADKLAGVQKELDELKAKNGEDYKTKFEKEHSEFEAYKKSVADKEAAAQKTAAVRAYFEGKGITGNNLEIAMRGAKEEINGAELADGKIKDTGKLDELISGTYKGLIVTTGTKGANTSTPPDGKGGGTKTKEEIMAIKDTAERQKAIAENHELFGI